MKNIALLSFFYTLLFLTSSCLHAAQSNQIKPPILDYYPNCEYEIVKVVSISEDSKKPKSKKFMNKVLSRLQSRAKREGADALILISRTINSIEIPPTHTLGRPVITYRLKFKAELIKQCHEDDLANRKRAKYDKNGKRAMLDMTVASTTLKKEYIFFNSAEAPRPTINNAEISLKNGIYGFPLGASYESMIGKFGKPSAVLSLLEDEVIAGYGRRHWFHFQSNKLVKVESKSNFLSRGITNQIPFLDYFDDYSWQINNKAAAKMSLSEVKSALDISNPINKHKELILSNNEHQLMLGFSHSRNSHTKKNSYTLMQFTLQSKDYKPNKLRSFAYKETQFQQITNLYKNIKTEKKVNLNEFLKSLGMPLGKIYLPKNITLNIYNPNLIITKQKEKLTSINLIEQVFLRDIQKHSPSNDWFLDSYQSGMSLDAAHKFFPEDTFQFNDKFEISTDDYALYLSFDDEILYEAEIKL